MSDPRALRGMQWHALPGAILICSGCAADRATIGPPVLPEPVSVVTKTASGDPALPPLRAELLRRRDAPATDDLAFLRGVIDEFGRPTAAQVGREGVEAFAALCHRSASEAELAARCLDLMDLAVAAGELSPRHPDRLYERLRGRK